MEFKAEIINGKPVVKAQVERKANGDVVIHIPSFPLINKLTEEHGKRNLQ